MTRMSRRYFKLTPGVVPGGWALGIPTDSLGREVEDSWVFTDGAPVANPGRYRLPTPSTTSVRVWGSRR